MRTVNGYFVERLLGPFTMMTDAERVENSSVEPGDEREVRGVIRSLLKPYFLRFDSRSQEIVKDSLRYLLATDYEHFEDLFEMSMPPFDPPPEQPRLFFVWLWEELFGPEGYELEEGEEYVVNHEIHAPNRIRLAPAE